MTTVIDTGTTIPAVIITNAAELGSRSGGILRAVATGALVRVDDNRVGCEAALLVPPQYSGEVLRLLGIDPATLPEPGSVRDHLV